MDAKNIDLQIIELLKECDGEPTVSLFLAEECFTVWEEGIRHWEWDGAIRYYHHIDEFDRYWDGSPAKIEHVLYLSDENDDIQVEISQEVANRIEELRGLINSRTDIEKIKNIDFESFLKTNL